MSKTSLLRELRSMEKEQLVEIILQAYTSSKETKEYFDFFVNPNPQQMYEKYSESITKEFSRTKRGHRTKARISVIKSAIKKFMTFEPGNELVTDLYLHAINFALQTEKKVYFSETLFNGIKKLACDAVVYSDKHGTAKQLLNGVDRLLDTETGTKYFRRIVKEGIADGLIKVSQS